MPEEIKSFPAIPNAHWFALRKKFRGTIPKDVTPSYLSSLLGMSEESARANVMGALRQTGIIDKDNKPTARANRWRQDEHYKEVCDEIREEIYPQELLDLAPDTATSLQSIQSWIANKFKIGEDAAKKQARFYFLLLEADPSKETNSEIKPSVARPNSKLAPKPKRSAKALPENLEIPSEAKVDTPSPVSHKLSPSLHIDIQIHIASDASAEQIDQIFASMAKHLKDF